MALPDYLASLAQMETYPETLIADITGEYDADIEGLTSGHGSVLSEKDAEIARLIAVNAALQETNTLLITQMGVSGGDGTNNGDDENDTESDEERAERVTFDDLMESE